MKETGYILVFISLIWWIISKEMQTILYGYESVNDRNLAQLQGANLDNTLVIFLAGIILICFGFFYKKLLILE